MPTYVMWVCDWDYNREVALVNQGSYGDWVNLDYYLAVNDVDSASVKLAPNSIKLENIDVMKRLLIYRDGLLRFSGVIMRKSWDEKIQTANNEFTIDALGGGVYLDWRVITPAAGQAYDERTDQADDLAKKYVYYHAGAGAAAARQFADLTVQADAAACSSWTEQPRYDNLLSEVQKLAELGAFDWRVTPTASGFEFQTGFPDWGDDRTWGNGVNTDAVFTLDRRNYEWIRYNKDTLDHYNHIYVLGQGEGADQTVVEREAKEDVAAYLRREKVISATAYEDSVALEYVGDMELRKHGLLEGLEVKPRATTYLNPWDVSDLVTIKISRHGWTYTTDAKIMAVNVKVGPDNVEQVEPQMKAISNMATNPNFMEPGSGGDVFEDWEDAAAAPLADETTTTFRESTHAAKLTRTGAGNCIMRQPGKPITPSSLYRMDVWSYGNGSHQGYMRVADDDGTTVTTNLPSAAGWSKTTHYIRVSSDATYVDVTCGMTAAVGAWVIIGLVVLRKV